MIFPVSRFTSSAHVLRAVCCVALWCGACDDEPPPPGPPPCTRHADCESGVCDVCSPARRGAGLCLPQSDVVYVQAGADCASATGDPGAPACSLSQAKTLVLAKGRRYIRLLPSLQSYGSVSFDSGTWAVFGPDAPAATPADRAQLSGAATDPATVLVSGTADVTLDSLALNAGRRGVQCLGGRLLLCRSVVENHNEAGLDIGACSFNMDRTRVAQNGDGGLALSGTRYDITNSFIVANTSSYGAAVRFSNDSTGTFLFNTVAGNVSGTASGLDCGMISRPITDSILVANAARSGSQTFGACALVRTVTGAGDKTPGGLADYTPQFLSPAAPKYDYSLVSMSPVNAKCCIGRGQKSTAVVADYFGNRRATETPVLGAHEVQ